MSTSSTDQEQPLQPTVGCEFEFILLIRKHVGISTEDAVARGLIIDALRQPLIVICEQCEQESTFDLQISSEATEDRSMWQVVHERTLSLHFPTETSQLQKLKAYDDYDIFPLELRSRILMADGPNPPKKRPCGHVLTWSEEITAVLIWLNNVFRRFDLSQNRLRKFLLHINRKCGFHVHVGSHGRHFSLDTTKRLLSLVVACERQIDQLHSADRVTGFDLKEPPHALPKKPFSGSPIIDTETYNLPYSMLFAAEANRKRWEHLDLQGMDASNKTYQALTGPFIAKYRRLEKSYSRADMWAAERLDMIDAWLVRIRNCNSIEDLQNVVKAPGKRCILNLDNLSDDPDTGKLGTIEFRQHKGTLQPDEACSFIDFAVALVTFSHNMGERLYNAFDGPGRQWRQANFTTLELCASIRCQARTLSHFYREHDPHTKDFSVWLREQRKHFEKANDNDPLKHLAIFAINDELERMDPYNVQERIKKKLLAGAYGRFSFKFLQEALPERTAEGWTDLEYLDSRNVADVDPALVNKASPDSDSMHVEGYSSEDDDIDS